MTPQEAAALLACAAAFDNRKPDPDAAQAWALALHGLRFHDCRQVIVAHYQRTGDWLMPHHVISEVRRLRAKRIAEAGDLTPPPNLTPLETVAWLGDTRRRIGDGETLEDPNADRKPHPELAAKVADLMPSPDLHAARVRAELNPTHVPAVTREESEQT